MKNFTQYNMIISNIKANYFKLAIYKIVMLKFLLKNINI